MLGIENRLPMCIIEAMVLDSFVNTPVNDGSRPGLD